MDYFYGMGEGFLSLGVTGAKPCKYCVYMGLGEAVESGSYGQGQGYAEAAGLGFGEFEIDVAGVWIIVKHCKYSCCEHVPGGGIGDGEFENQAAGAEAGKEEKIGRNFRKLLPFKDLRIGQAAGCQIEGKGFCYGVAQTLICA